MSVYDLTGRKALVTGGARGLGAGMAEALARAGAAVVIGDIREELGEATADAIKKAGGDAAFLPLNVTDERSWERAAELGDRALDGPLPAVVVRHVQREERGVAAGLLDRVDGRLAEFLADVADDDGRTGPGQRLGHPRAEPAGPAGDQGLASGQVVHTHGTSPP